MAERYQINEIIGTGGFGAIYEAFDTELNRQVAIKRLQAANYVDHVELRDRLLSEAKVLAEINHPHIASIYDVIETTEGGDIIMEFVEGISLSAFMEECEPLDLDSFLIIAVQLLNAVHAAHDKQIIHSNLKPENIILNTHKDGSYHSKVINFGITPSFQSENLAVSAQHNLMGAIHFMAPELLGGNAPTNQSDIYALGCIFFYALTGKYPYQDSSSACNVHSEIKEMHTPIRQLIPELPEGFGSWLEKHFTQNLNERFASCADSLAQLLKIEGLKAIDTFKQVYPKESLSSTRLYSLSSLKNASVAISEKQMNEFKKKKNISSMTKSKNLVPIAERYARARPEELWYFAVNNVRKGPINFEKVCELIAKGYIRSTDTLWHVRLGQWTPAAQVPEFHEEFQEAFSMPPRPEKTQRVNPHQAKTVNHQTGSPRPVAFNSTEEENSAPIEIAFTTSFFVLAAFTVTLFPEFWQTILLSLSGCLLAFALIFNRMRMVQTHSAWLACGLVLPILSDFAFALVKPKKGAQNFIILVLSCAFLYYAYNHRLHGDALSHPLIEELLDTIESTVK